MLGLAQGPYLYKVKFSSFGRHFTKIDKLETVTDYLMYYLRPGDCCVDFRCASNNQSKEERSIFM